MLQQLLQGTEFSSYSIAHEGHLILHCDTVACASNLRYANVGDHQVHSSPLACCGVHIVSQPSCLLWRVHFITFANAKLLSQLAVRQCNMVGTRSCCFLGWRWATMVPGPGTALQARERSASQAIYVLDLLALSSREALFPATWSNRTGLESMWAGPSACLVCTRVVRSSGI